MATSKIESVSKITNSKYYPLSWGSYGEGTGDVDVPLDHPLKSDVLTCIVFGLNGRHEIWATNLVAGEIRSMQAQEGSFLLRVKDENTVTVSCPNDCLLKQIVQYPYLHM